MLDTAFVISKLYDFNMVKIKWIVYNQITWISKKEKPNWTKKNAKEKHFHRVSDEKWNEVENNKMENKYQLTSTSVITKRLEKYFHQ